MTLTSVVNASRDINSLYSSYRGLPVNPNFFHSQETATDLIITCLELDLGKQLIPSSKNLKIYADVVRVNESVSIPGKNVTVYARQVIAPAGGAAIDVSGTNTAGAGANEKMPDGVGYGEAGQSSTKTGPAGGDAGNIWIIAEDVVGNLSLKADGGKGGKGINGGNGAPGGPGANGADGQKTDGEHPGQRGGRGVAGGAAGRGGDGGRGGNAGTVNVKLLRWPPLTAVSISALRGSGGDGGKRGQPGPGGPGGIGGINWYCYTECECVRCDLDRKKGYGRNIEVEEADEAAEKGGAGEEQVDDDKGVRRALAADLILAQAAEVLGCRKYCFQKGRAPSGDWGPGGASAEDGKTGVQGSSIYYNSSTQQMDYGPAVTQAQFEDLAAVASGSQLLMLLHRAELDYLRGAYHQCAISLSWLQKLMQTAAPPPPPLSAVEWSAMKLKVQAYITQLKSGLDFYGLPRNFVPLVSLDTYKQVVDILLDVAESVETSYASYWKANDDKGAQLAALEKALGTSRDAISRMEIEKGQVLTLSAETEATIASLTVSMSRQELVLREADDAFKRAVQDQAGGCEFMQVVGFIASVVSVAVGAYPAAAAIVTSVSSLAEKGLALKNVIETVKVVGKSLPELQKAYNEIAPLLATKPDAAKILVNRDDYKEVLKPYMDLPEAQAYKRDIEFFLDLVDARNSKVLEYTSLQVRYVELGAAATQLGKEIQQVETAVAAAQNPGIVEAVNFMGRMLTQAKALVIRALYQEYRAYEYWALKELPLAVDDQDIARLRFTHGNLVAAETAALEDRGRKNQLFTQVRLTLTDRDYPREFAEFRRTGRFVFTIPPSHPAFRADWRVITLKEVKIVVPEAETSDGILSVTLIHSGRATFIDEGGALREFTHRPRSTNVTYYLNDGALITPVNDNLGGEKGKYSDLSPFSVWTLLVPAEYNTGLKLGRVKKVEFEFAGYFLPKKDSRFKIERRLTLDEEPELHASQAK